MTGPEDPGRYCFPPVAAFIVGPALPMLALLALCITDLGGTFAMCDTDSMTNDAAEIGGLVSRACEDADDHDHGRFDRKLP